MDRQAFLHRLVVGAVSGFAAGLLPGLGARLVMALMVILAGGQSTFSVGGTGLILLLGGAIGAFLGMYYALLHGRLPGTNWWSRALVFGAMVLIGFGLGYALFQPQGSLISVHPAAQMVYYLIPFVFALLLIPLHQRLAVLISPPEWRAHRIRTLLVYLPGVLIMLLGLAAGWFVIMGAIFGTVEIIGRPMNRWLMAGQRVPIDLGFVAAAVLLISVPGLLVAALLLPLRSVIPGPMRLRGLVLGVILALICVAPAYAFVISSTPFERIARFGAALIALAFVVSGAITGLLWAGNEDGHIFPLRRGAVIQIGVAALAFFALMVANQL